MDKNKQDKKVNSKKNKKSSSEKITPKKKKEEKIPNVKFKEVSRERLEQEWKMLDKQNKHLKALLRDVNSYVWKKYKKSILLTMILRTQTEQDELYLNSVRYRRKKFKSPHQFWHGADLRSRIFNEKEIDDIVKYINKKYDKPNYYRWSAKCHNVGHGDHFHIQYYKV